MAKTFKKISNCENKKIIITTVGLADYMDIENTNNIKNSIKRQLPNEIHEKAKRLSEKKTAEVKAMIDTYNKKINFVDFSGLQNIIVEIQN